MYVSCCRRTFTFQMTGRQKYAAAMTGTIQGPIYLHIALEWLSLCDSGVWGWVAGILCSACWNKVDCWILFHNWIDFVHRSKSGSQLKSSTISKTVSTSDFWQTLSLHLIQILFATFYSFSTFWSGGGGVVGERMSQLSIVYGRNVKIGLEFWKNSTLVSRGWSWSYCLVLCSQLSVDLILVPSQVKWPFHKTQKIHCCFLVQHVSDQSKDYILNKKTRPIIVICQQTISKSRQMVLMILKRWLCQPPRNVGR